MKRQIPLLSLFLVLHFLGLHGQTKHVWTLNTGGSGTDYGAGVVLDNQGNIYTTGRFSVAVDFDPGAGNELLTSNGSTDVYIQKLDASGNFLWAKSFGGAGEDRAHSIGVDQGGNVYITGNFRGSVDFDPGQGSFVLSSTSVDDTDAFIVKLDANGNFEWAKQIGSEGGAEWGHAIAVDSEGNSYSTGYFSNTIDLNPNAGTVPATVTGGTSNDLYLIKLSADGDYLWGHAIGGTGQERAYGIELDAGGDLLVTGQFGKDVDFDPGPGTAVLTTGTTTVALDGFLLKLDSDGQYVWAVNIGSSGDYDYAWSVKSDLESNLYYTGYFKGTVDMDPGPGVFNVTSNGGRDAFLVKLDKNGAFLWGEGFGGIGNEYSRSLEVDDQTGNVYIAASQYTSELANWGSGTCLNEIQGMPGTEEVLVLASYSAEGEHLCAFGIETAQGGFYSAGWHSQMDIVEGQMYFVSNYSSSDTDYDPSSEVYHPPFAGGAWDIALTRYSLDPFNVDLGGDSGFCEGGSTVLDATVPDGSYLWQDNSTAPTFEVSVEGTYFVDVRSAGCVAKDTVEMAVSDADNTVTLQGVTILSNDDNATYQWIDCADNSPIEGANEQSFSPTSTGNYAVIVNNSGCEEVSECVSVVVSSTHERAAQQVKIYPNPVSDFDLVTIEFDQYIPDGALSLYQADGRLVRTFENQGERMMQLYLNDLPKGLYWIQWQVDQQLVPSKLIKQ